MRGRELVADAFSSEARRPRPKVATNVTSVSPIMSAAAVAAVRDGLRIAFSRASRPAAPPRRSDGKPTIEASGRTSRGASIAMPTKSPSAPRPMPSARMPPLTPSPSSP